jgi:hypothetical protein
MQIVSEVYGSMNPEMGHKLNEFINRDQPRGNGPPGYIGFKVLWVGDSDTMEGDFYIHYETLGWMKLEAPPASHNPFEELR